MVKSLHQPSKIIWILSSADAFLHVLRRMLRTYASAVAFFVRMISYEQMGKHLLIQSLNLSLVLSHGPTTNSTPPKHHLVIGGW